MDFRQVSPPEVSGWPSLERVKANTPSQTSSIFQLLIPNIYAGRVPRILLYYQGFGGED